MKDLEYYIIYKPFGMLSQFSREGDKPTLADLHDFPRGVYPVGRLDADSEGLLILTNDTKLNHRLLDPKFRHVRTYLIQVDGQVTPEALQMLRDGVSIKISDKDYFTLPAEAQEIPEPANLPDRDPPVRFRKSIPTSWISLSLQEGKNRQVRKMTAKAGFPTLRLIRTNIENLSLGDMKPGDVKEMDRLSIYRALKIR